MRIFSIAQDTSKIPTQFRGNQIPPEAIDIIRRLDEKYRLSYGEVEWIVESLEEEYNYITSAPKSWSKVEESLEIVFAWSRANQKSVLRSSLATVVAIGYTYSLDQKIKQQFEDRDWARGYLSRLDNQFKKNFLALDAQFPGGITIKEASWLEQKVKLSTNANLLESSQVKSVLTWSRATKIDLDTIPSYEEAKTKAFDWADYQRKVDLSKRLSKKSLRSVALKNKWKAVWVDPNATAKPDPNVVDRQGNIKEDFDCDVERGITGISLQYSNNIISIRDPLGVPQASLAIGEEEDGRIEVRDLEATQEGKQKVVEFVNKMKAGGVKLWLVDPIEIDSLDSIVKEFAENYGFIITVKLGRIGNVSDADGYYDVIEAAYQASERRSFRSSIDNLVYYADQRDELLMLEKAQERFSDKAGEMWMEYSGSDDSLPAMPDRDDSEFENPDGSFNEAAFDAAETEYERQIGIEESHFEPYKFSNYLFEAVNRGKKNSSNKALYEEEARKEEQARVEEANKQKVLDEERRIRRLEQEEEERKRQVQQQQDDLARQIQNATQTAGDLVFDTSDYFDIEVD